MLTSCAKRDMEVFEGVGTRVYQCSSSSPDGDSLIARK